VRERHLAAGAARALWSDVSVRLATCWMTVSVTFEVAVRGVLEESV